MVIKTSTDNPDLSCNLNHLNFKPDFIFLRDPIFSKSTLWFDSIKSQLIFLRSFKIHFRCIINLSYLIKLELELPFLKCV